MTIKIWLTDASTCRVMKNPQHYSTIWEILSYNKKFRDRTGQFRIEKASFFSSRSGSFGYGLLSYVKKQLIKQQLDFIVEDKRQFICKEIKTKKQVNFKNITLEPYQIAASNLPDQHKMGIIQSPTGSGKGIIAASLIEKLNRPRTIMVVPTKSIFYGVIEELEKTLQCPIGRIGDSNSSSSTENIVVALYQTLINCDLKNLNDWAELIIIDEAHGAKSSSIQTILSSLYKVYYRYGLTATPVLMTDKENWMAVTGQLGEVILKVNDEEVSDRVTNVDAYMFNHNGKVTQSGYQNIYRKDVLLSIERCKVIVKMATYALKNMKRKNCLILVDEYEQARVIEMIATRLKLPTKIAWSGLSTEELDDLKNKLNTSKIKCVIATPVWGVGTNIPQIDSVVLGGARKSYINLLQKIGRGRRKVVGKDSLLHLDVYDNYDDKFFTEYANKRMIIYKIKKWFRGIIE